MVRELSVLDRRNRLFVKIIWVMLALGIATDLAIGLEMKMVLTLAIVGSIMSGAATAMTYLGILRDWIKYVIPSITTVMIGMLIVSDPNPIISTYFLVYVNIAIITLYMEYKPIIYTGVLSAGFTTYIFMDPVLQQQLFPGESLIYLYLYIVFATAALAFSAHFSQKLQRQVISEQKEALTAKELSEALLGKLKSSIHVLTEFGESQKETVRSTGDISREITATFSEMSSAIEKQTSNIVNVNDTTQTIEKSVDELLGGTAMLMRYSSHNAELTEENKAQTELLVSEMERVSVIIDHMAKMMQELNEQNEHVSVIVATIGQISEQTNLLALNAAIEAARAGEHGKGFAVVSGEVRKLADHARSAADEISEKLSAIRAQINAVHSGVESGQAAAALSREATLKVRKLTGQIDENTELVKEHSLTVGGSAQHLYEQYKGMAEDISLIAVTTQQNMASVEEVQASMETQDGKINVMVSDYIKLERLLSELKEMTAGNKQ